MSAPTSHNAEFGEALHSLKKRLCETVPNCPAAAYITVQLPVEQWGALLAALSGPEGDGQPRAEWHKIPKWFLATVAGEAFTRDELRQEAKAMIAKAPQPEAGADDARDAARYRWLRDSGLAVAAWQDVGAVHWALNGVEYLSLDEGVDEQIKRQSATSCSSK